MSVRIQVLDRHNRPVEDRKVFVSWQSGSHSEARTNSSGVADLGTRGGSAKYIQVGGEEVSGPIQLEDKVYQFTVNH